MKVKVRESLEKLFINVVLPNILNAGCKVIHFFSILFHFMLHSNIEYPDGYSVLHGGVSILYISRRSGRIKPHKEVFTTKSIRKSVPREGKNDFQIYLKV